MKKLLIFLIIFLQIVILLSFTACGKDKYSYLIKPKLANVILIYGQSNASGCTRLEYLKENDLDIYNKFEEGVKNVLTNHYCDDRNVSTYFKPTKIGMGTTTDTFGSEIGIANEFSTCKENTYIIKWSVGGSNLRWEWLNGNGERGNYYKSAVEFTKNQLNYLKRKGVKIRVLGAFWMQGESDSFEEYACYEQNTYNLISYLREDLTELIDSELNFVDAYISTKTGWTHSNEINQAKTNVANRLPNVYVIKTNGEDENSIDLEVNFEPKNEPDRAHYDSMSMILLGKTVAKTLKEINDI